MDLPPGVDLSTTPILPPPYGQISNFVDPPSQAPTMLGSGISLGTVSLIVVVIRIWTNSKIVKRLYLDDYICILAWCGTTGYFIVAACLGRLDRHIYDIPITEFNESAVQLYFAGLFISGPACWATKAAILTLYTRLFGAKKWLRWTSCALIAALGMIFFSSSIIAGVFCAPRSGEPWGVAILLPCADAAIESGIFYGAVGLAADMALLIMPLPIIFRLNMSKAKKIALAGVFLMGIFAIAASTVALYYRIIVYNSIDATWEAANSFTGVLVEGYVTIMVSCAPAMSSFWIHKLSETAFITSIRNLITRSRQSSADKTSSPKPTRAGSSTVFNKRSNRSAELNAYHKDAYPLTNLSVVDSTHDVYPEFGSNYAHGGILKSTVIEHSSESV